MHARVLRVIYEDITENERNVAAFIKKALKRNSTLLMWQIMVQRVF